MVARSSLVTVLVAFVVAVAGQQCYGVDGSALDKTYTPCDPSAKHSACCASGDVCLSNGLCMGTADSTVGMIFSRGCTDSTGKDTACPQLCPGAPTNFNTTQPSTAWQLQTCDMGEYCCRAADSIKSCCNNPAAPKIKGPLNATLQLPSALSKAGTTSSSSTSDQDQDATPAAPATQSSKTPIPEPNCAKEKSHEIIIGATLGGLLAGITTSLALAVAWMHKKERRQRRLKEHYETQMSKTNAYRKALESCVGSARPSLALEETTTNMTSKSDSGV